MENVLEFLDFEEQMTLTLHQKKYVNKIKKLAEKYPNEVTIDYVNKDGTILAHMPTSYLHLFRPHQMSEEQRQAFSEKAKENLSKYWFQKNQEKEEETE